MSLEELWGKTPAGESDQRLDPMRLVPGQYISYLYFRGSRAGQRREAEVVSFGSEKAAVPTADCPVWVREGDRSSRQVMIWPNLTDKVDYTPRGEDMAGGIQEKTSGVSGLNLNEVPEEWDLVVATGCERSKGGPAARASAATRTRTPKAKSRTRGEGASSSSGYPREAFAKLEGWKALTGQLPAKSLKEPDPVAYYSGPAMLPVVETHCKTFETLDVMQYIVDHTELLNMIVAQALRGKVTRMILDKGNFISSSCKRQCARVKELHSAGVQIKILRPKAASGFASMHTKCVIVNKKVALTGSCNLTHGGFEHNIEHLLEIHDPKTVAKILLDFERHWVSAEAVTESLLALMESKWQARHGRGQSVPRGIDDRRARSDEESSEPQGTQPDVRSRPITRRNSASLLGQ